MPTTSIRIDLELEKRLRTICKLTGRPKAWYVRQALEAYLAQEEWLTEAIREGIKAAEEGRFASEEDVRAAFAGWGVNIED